MFNASTQEPLTMIPTPKTIGSLVECLERNRFGATLLALVVVFALASWVIVYGPWR